MKIKQATISFWFKELSYNPICKVGELENCLNNHFNVPFLINDCEPFVNIGMPRIVARSDDAIFNMTLINAHLNIVNFYTSDVNEVILKINEMMQTVFAILKEIYEIDCIYSSIKIELLEPTSLKDEQNKLFNNNEDLEEFMMKKTIKYDNKYYLNTIITLSKEVTFNIKNPTKNNPSEGDLLARSMLISLKDSQVKGEIKNTIFEINNRLGYNIDNNYRVNKDEIRNLLFEFKLKLTNLIKEKE